MDSRKFYTWIQCILSIFTPKSYPSTPSRSNPQFPNPSQSQLQVLFFTFINQSPNGYTYVLTGVGPFPGV